MKPLLCLVIVAIFFTFFGCNLNLKLGTRVTLRWARGGPSDITGFKCLGLNVVGEGIPSVDSQINSDWQSVENGKTCSYPGFSTVSQALNPAAPNNVGAVFELKVTPGKRRVFQVIGVNTRAECPREDIGTLLSMARQGTLPSSIEGLYEVGRTTADVRATASVEVKNAYTVSGAYNLKDCFPKDSVSLSVTPKSLTLAPGDYYQVKPAGGVPPYSYTTLGTGSFISVNDSGVVNAVGGPPLPATLRVKDFAGSSVDVNVDYFSPSAYGNLSHWYRPSQYLPTQADDTEVSLPLLNRGNLAAAALYTGTPIAELPSTRFRRTSASNGFPSARLYTGLKFSYSGPGASIMGDHAAYVVGKRSNRQLQADVLCFSTSGGCAGQFFRLVMPGGLDTLLYALNGDATSSSISVTPSSGAKQWNLYRGRWGGGGTSIEVSLNGELSSVSTSNSTLSIGSGFISVGGVAGTPGTDYFEFAEVLIYDSLGSYPAVESYLNAKYGLY